MIAPPAGVAVNAEGKVEEMKRARGRPRPHHGAFVADAAADRAATADIANGIYLFVDSGQPEGVVCNAQEMGVRADTLVFDEFAGRVLEAKCAASTLAFKTPVGPSVVQLRLAPPLWRRASWYAPRRSCASSSPQWCPGSRVGHALSAQGVVAVLPGGEVGRHRWRTPARAAWRWWAAPTPPQCRSGSTSIARVQSVRLAERNRSPDHHGSRL